MRRVLCAAVAAVLIGVPATASAAGNGQLAAISGPGRDRLVTFNADGSGAHTLVSTANHRLADPSWSPDGNAIAYTDDGRIMLYDLASGQTQALTAGPADTSPTWSPDGAWIAFGRYGDVLELRRDGGGVDTLADSEDGENVDGLAWSPDGTTLAVVSQDALELVPLDDEDGAIAVPSRVTGSPAWSPDSEQLAYTRGNQFDSGTQVLTLPGGPTGGAAIFDDDSGPTFSPDGRLLAYSHYPSLGTAILRTVDLADGSRHDVVTSPAVAPLDPDWQPCIAPTTSSCVSQTPVVATPSLSCPASTSLTVVAGKGGPVPVACIGTRVMRYEIVARPAHGTAGGSSQLGYRPFSTYSGPDSFTYRAYGANGLVSGVATVAITVTPAPAAPTLTALATPKLDRRARALLQARCDRACTVSLRLSAKLNTGRVVLGKAGKASAPAGGTLRLRLTRGKVPKRRRVVSVRIVGTVTGADGLHRAFTLTLKR